MSWDDTDHLLLESHRDVIKNAILELVKVEKQRNTIINKAVEEICERLNRIAYNIGCVGS